MNGKKEYMQELIKKLNDAAKAYYAEGREIMSNLEYDKLYDELEALEAETGVIMANSPTQKVGYEVLSDLPKETHPSRMLSLDKTKDREALAAWLGEKEGILSWKLDGLTIVLTYTGGELTKAVTRGNGTVGEVITNNAKVFKNVPRKISFGGELVLRGEAVISYAEFERINSEIPDAEAKYKNPRNLCSGSVRQLNNRITAERNVEFYAFSLVSAEGVEFKNSRENQLKWLSSQGFDVVEYRRINRENTVEAVDDFEKRIAENPIPSDGLVLMFDDIEYSRSLGTTAKFPRDAIAFKWQDQISKTVLREIEWSASRTGLINPIAVFDPVELEGTTVSRASVHNISIAEELELGIGDEIEVYKANMIIPQIASNLTKSGNLPIPKVCPVCGRETVINDENGVKTLVCTNSQCTAKKIKSFSLFVSRDAMNIEGLSEATLEKMIAKGFIHEYADIFKLKRFEEEITQMEGFGQKSFDNLCKSIDNARHTVPAKLLGALGIPGIGVTTAAVIARACKNSWKAMESIGRDELTAIDGIGDVMADGYIAYFSDEKNREMLQHLLPELIIDETFEENESFMNDLTFVITGSLNHFGNRNELKAEIEKAGGKVSGSVSKKTSYLINNDVTSTSGKNKKAMELGVKIVDEETVMGWLENKAVN